MGSTARIPKGDNRMPISPHPLSYSELERHGFEDLVLPTVEYGGPHRVGTLVGIEWADPREEKLQIDESLRPQRVESHAFDLQGYDLKNLCIHTHYYVIFHFHEFHEFLRSKLSLHL